MICVAVVLVALLAGVMSGTSPRDRLPLAETSALGASGRLPERLPPPAGALPGDLAPGPAGPDGSSGPAAPGGRRPTVAADAAAVAGIPVGVLKAYRGAEIELGTGAPSCRLAWPLLAAIGKVESDHARDGAIDAAGTTLTPILGPVLDGSDGTAAIPDTDGGKLDGDPVWDRAVGPSQFIPSTWRAYAIDADDDGSADPNNVDDAATATGRYLCAGDTDLADPTQRHDAVFRYNHSESYVATVLDWARTYAAGGVPAAPDVAADAPAPGDPATPTHAVLLAGPDDRPTALPPAAAPPPAGSPPAASAPGPSVPDAPLPVALPSAAAPTASAPPVAPPTAADAAPVAPSPVRPPAARPSTAAPPRPAAVPAPRTPPTAAPRPRTTPLTTTPLTTTPLTATPPPSTTPPTRVGQDRPCAGLDATTVATALGVDPSSATTTTSSAGTTVTCTVSTRAGVILRAVLTDRGRGRPGTISVGGVAAVPGGGWQVSGDIRGRHVTLGVPSAAGVTAQNARTALPVLARWCD